MTWKDFSIFPKNISQTSDVYVCEKKRKIFCLFRLSMTTMFESTDQCLLNEWREYFMQKQTSN